ncbi:lateral tail fiber protein [Escherichia phage BrunoManser]|uniref:Lateral tail fiber protein n=1 Tax=Escherichia phage BrunoManser TaxID=2851976 RepID=A0AAE8AXJ6_9CAUD|nr:lateral tail fiber protein [Escherichia phage BrunoManser]
MALYRQGEASMTAEGQVTGVGTQWREPLSLIRKGATIVFLTTPLKLAVINTIDSDTEMTAITTDGEAVAQSKYVILLNDSLTVDGMAQDVAETLRYYQSKETVIEEAIEFFKDFDLQQIITLRNETQTFRNDAETFKGQAEASKTQAGTYANESLFYRNEAEGFKNQTQQIKDNALSEVGTAQTNAVNTVNKTRDQAVIDVNNAKSDIGGMVTQAENARNAAQTAQSGSETARDQSQAFRNQAEQFANSVNPDALLRKDGNLSGLTDVNAARSNLGLSANQVPVFGGIEFEAKNGTTSGIIALRNNNPDGSKVSYSRIYHEMQNGVAKTTIQTAREGGGTNYLQINERGDLNNVNEINASGRIRSLSSEEKEALRVDVRRTTGNGAFVAGEVEGGYFAAWRDRAAGVIVELPGSDSAVNIFKAVQLGADWVTGVDCTRYDSGMCETHLYVRSALFRFTDDGVAMAANWTSTSDLRMKTNLKKIESASERVERLVGYTYYKRNELHETDRSLYSVEAGLIAQDLEFVLPEAVVQLEDNGKTPDAKKEGMKGVNYAGVTALLVNAFNEQKERADKAEGRVDELEERLAKLESLLLK